MKGERGAVHEMKEGFVTSVLVYGCLFAFEYEGVKSMKKGRVKKWKKMFVFCFFLFVLYVCVVCEVVLIS